MTYSSGSCFRDHKEYCDSIAKFKVFLPVPLDLLRYSQRFLWIFTSFGQFRQYIIEFVSQNEAQDVMQLFFFPCLGPAVPPVYVRALLYISYLSKDPHLFW